MDPALRRGGEAERRAAAAAIAKRNAEEHATAAELARAEAEEEALLRSRQRAEAEALLHEQECARLEASERALHAAAERERVEHTTRAVQISALEARETTQSAVRGERGLRMRGVKRTLTRGMALILLLALVAAVAFLSMRLAEQPAPAERSVPPPVFQLDKKLDGAE
ncbi:MAG: hypothetical protein ACXWHA_12725 [Usitatibacter sp.]